MNRRRRWPTEWRCSDLPIVYRHASAALARRDGYTKVGQRLGDTEEAAVLGRFLVPPQPARNRWVRVRQEFGVWRWTKSRLNVHHFAGSLGLRLAHTGPVCESRDRAIWHLVENRVLGR